MKNIKSLSLALVFGMALVLIGCTERGASAYEEIEIPAGTSLQVRLDRSAVTDEDHFTGVLAQPIEIQGRLIAPSGTRVEGSIDHDGDSDLDVDGERSEQMHAQMITATLDKLILNGEEYSIKTETVPVGTLDTFNAGAEVEFMLSDEIELPVAAGHDPMTDDEYDAEKKQNY